MIRFLFHSLTSMGVASSVSTPGLRASTRQPGTGAAAAARPVWRLPPTQLGLGEPDGPQAQRRGLHSGVADGLSPLFERLHLVVFGQLEEDRSKHLLGHDRSLLDLLDGLLHLRDPIMGLICVERLGDEPGLVAATNSTAVVAVGRGSGLL